MMVRFEDINFPPRRQSREIESIKFLLALLLFGPMAVTISALLICFTVALWAAPFIALYMIFAPQ